MVVGHEDCWLLFEVVNGGRCWLLAMMIIGCCWRWVIVAVGGC